MKLSQYREMMMIFTDRLAETYGTEDFKDAHADYLDFFRIGARNDFTSAIDPHIPDELINQAIEDGNVKAALNALDDMAKMISILREENYSNIQYWLRTFVDFETELHPE